jgi:hypothetical protein
LKPHQDNACPVITGESHFDLVRQFLAFRFLFRSGLGFNEFFLDVEGWITERIEGRDGFPLLIGPRQDRLKRGVFWLFLVALPMASPCAGDAPDRADEAVCKTDAFLIPEARPVEDSCESLLDKIVVRPPVGGPADAGDPVQGGLLDPLVVSASVRAFIACSMSALVAGWGSGAGREGVDLPRIHAPSASI